MVVATIHRMLTANRAGPAAIPAGRRVYAVGDIHGRRDLFDELVARIDADRAGRPCDIVLLGDYVDRGPHSAQLLDRLVALPDWATWTLLKGNHEQTLLDALRDGPDADAIMQNWLRFGGEETLRSYGLPARLLFGSDPAALRHRLRELMPSAHHELLASLRLTHRIGDYFFVHAGVRPGVALDAQDPLDLLWIRKEFLDSRADHGAVIVHGHSISAEAAMHPNRIGIDTGAYATGRLTALALEGTARWLLSTGRARGSDENPPSAEP